MTLKKIGLAILAFVGIAVGTNVYADTIGGSFTSIPIYQDSDSTTDITQDLNLKVGGLVDQTNGVYYAVGTIPDAWSGTTVAGIDVKSADNCDDSDINSTCVEAGASAVFVLKGDDSGVTLQKIIQLYGNGIKAGTNWWGIHKNQEGDVFLIENIGADLRIWTLVGSDLSNPTLTADSPVTLDTNIDEKGGISIVNDYLFYHGTEDVYSDYREFPRFVVISLNGATPTMVYQWGEDKSDGRVRICLKLSSDVTSWDAINPSMIQGIFIAQDSDDPLVPYSDYNAVRQGYNYCAAMQRDSMSIKGMFIKDNKLYAIVYLGGCDSNTDFLKESIGSDGKVDNTQLQGDIGYTRLVSKIGKYYIMQFDFSPVNQ